MAGHWTSKLFGDNLAFGYPFNDSVADAKGIAWFIVLCAGA